MIQVRRTAARRDRAARPASAVLATTLLAATLTLAGGAPAAGGATARAEAEVSLQTAIIKATNRRRAAHDLRPLRTARCAVGFAWRHSDLMAERGLLVHSSLTALATRCAASHVAENVAVVRGKARARRVLRMWMRSPGHRANILDPQLSRLGVGVARGAGGTWYVTQDFFDRG